MRIIIEARIQDGDGGIQPIRLAEFERADNELKQLGLSLAEGKSLVYEAQRALVKAQAQVFVAAARTCPQLRVCKCRQGTNRKSFSPLALALPLRTSPELEYLQVKWAAHLPYAVATALLKETLPVDQAISASGLRNRVWAVGQELDGKAEGAIRGEQDYPPIDDQAEPVALAVDSAWLRHRFTRLEKEQARVADLSRYKPSLPRGRHVNIIAGRAVRADGTCRVYGYVNKEVTSAATRLDHFL